MSEIKNEGSSPFTVHSSLIRTLIKSYEMKFLALLTSISIECLSYIFRDSFHIFTLSRGTMKSVSSKHYFPASHRIAHSENNFITIHTPIPAFSSSF